ncbi:MAG: chemotaxis protein CheW [Ignavibacteriaceae bacterium]|nr:chemotaxis protein CheW [Ignavibacteriaceae bacterium]
MGQSNQIELTSLLIFYIDKHELCLDMKDLVKIMDPPVLDMSDEKDMLWEHGGIIFTVINLHKLFNVKNNGLTFQSKLILLEIKEKTVCFLVDKVIEMIASTEKSSESRVFIPSTDPNLKGVIQYEGREILVPNFDSMVNGHTNKY